MKIITLFIITLSRILAILPSYVLAQCQRDVKITFYGWPDNGGNAKVSGSCGGRTKAGGKFHPAILSFTLKSSSITWAHIKQELEPLKIPLPSQQPAGSSLAAKSFMSLISRNLRVSRICVEHAVRFTPLVLKEAIENSNIVYVAEDDKANSNDIRVDIFIGSNTANGGRLVQKCERTLTPGDKQTIIRKGGNAFPVDCKCSYNGWSPCMLILFLPPPF